MRLSQVIGSSLISRNRGCPEQVAVLPAFESECELVKLGVQVFADKLVVGTDEGPREEGPNALKRCSV